MRPIRVGLMGFGRIGRSLFRILYDNDEIQVAAIAEVADHAALEYVLRFDTILGRFPDEVSIREGNLYVVGKQIPMVEARGGSDMPWGDLGVDVVISATGQMKSRADLEGHFEQGAKRVILCSPPLEEPDITVVMGVNDGDLRPEHRVISNASCTAHCAAPLMSILHRAFGIEKAFLSTIHAYTNQQRLADVPSEDPRRGRAAAENIIPQETNAADMVMQLIPALEGRVRGKAFNVPVANGSVVDLVCWHEKTVTPTAINEVVRTAAATEHWQGILDYEDEPIVSSDIILSSHSGTFDAQATMVLGEKVSKTLAWYDNSWGYAHRVIDLLRAIQAFQVEEVA